MNCLLKTAVFLLILSSLLSCDKEEDNIANRNYFIINDEKYEIKNVANYISIYKINSVRVAYTTLIISDTNYDAPSIYYEYIAEGKYGINKSNVILITYKLDGIVETVADADDLTHNLVGTFDAVDVKVGLNFDSITNSYESIEPLKYLENNSYSEFGIFHIDFKGKTSSGITVECKFVGNWSVQVI